MQFSKVIGQQEVKSRLVKMVSENRLSHALLFLASEGTGGLQLALAFAQYILVKRYLANKVGIYHQFYSISQRSLFYLPIPAESVAHVKRPMI